MDFMAEKVYFSCPGRLSTIKKSILMEEQIFDFGGDFSFDGINPWVCLWALNGPESEHPGGILTCELESVLLFYFQNFNFYNFTKGPLL